MEPEEGLGYSRERMSGVHRALVSAPSAPGSVWDGTLTRRSFLGWSVAAAAGIAASHFFLLPGPRGRVALTWLAPRAALDALNDYPIWVALDRGYMNRLGIDLDMAVAGDNPPPTTTPRRAITFPSPAELVSGVDRGLATTSVFQLSAGSVFGFAFSTRGMRRRPLDLDQATIAVGDESWKSIVDPLLIEAGVNPVGTRLIVAGPHWFEAVRRGEADAAVSWRGMENSAAGRGLRHLVGDRHSQLPANSYAVEGIDGMSVREVDGLKRFLQAVVMGLEFASQNPRAAAQITYRSTPGLHTATTPQAAVDQLTVTASIYDAGRKRGLKWGEHDAARWQRYLNVAHQAGLVKGPSPGAVFTNRFIAFANSFDPTVVRLDATTFPMDTDFRHTTGPRGGSLDG